MRNVACATRSLLLAWILMCVSQVAAAFTYEITETELQQKISAAMPLEINKPHYTLMISDPVVDLNGQDGGIAVLAKIEFLMPSTHAIGNIALNSKLAYEPDTSSFFLKNILVNQIVLEGVPESYLPGVKLLAQLVASRMFATHPVYVIKDDSIKNRFAKSHLKSVLIKDGKLILLLELL